MLVTDLRWWQIRHIESQYHEETKVTNITLSPTSLLPLKILESWWMLKPFLILSGDNSIFSSGLYPLQGTVGIVGATTRFVFSMVVDWNELCVFSGILMVAHNSPRKCQNYKRWVNPPYESKFDNPVPKTDKRWKFERLWSHQKASKLERIKLKFKIIVLILRL